MSANRFENELKFKLYLFHKAESMCWILFENMAKSREFTIFHSQTTNKAPIEKNYVFSIIKQGSLVHFVDSWGYGGCKYTQERQNCLKIETLLVNTRFS